MWNTPQFVGGEVEAGPGDEDGHHSVPELTPCCTSLAVSSA